MTLEGLEVLLFQPDFATPPRLVGTQKSDEVSLSQAPRLQAYVSETPLHAFTHKFKFTSRADAASFEDFITDRAGKWQPFWCPSWHGELNPVATIANGSNQLAITPVNYATVFNPTDSNVAKLGHYIFLVHYDGTFLVRKVTSVSGTSPEVLTLDSGVTREFALGQFVVGFLYCVTLISDKVTLNYNGADNISVDLALTEEPSIDDSEATTGTPTPVEYLVANFESDVVQGDPPLTVAFTDLSEGTPISWLWQFRDGTSNSTSQNPTHEFTNSGTYAVKLTVRDASGRVSTITREIVVNAEAVPPGEVLAADFTATPDSGDLPLVVAFTDESTGTPIVWLWNFGDGSSFSGEQNPSHTYVAAGVYTVTLKIHDTNGATSTKVGTIEVTEATASVVTCDSGEDYDDPGGYFTGTSCSPCCTELDAMAVDDLKIWTQIALLNCLGVTAGDGVTFEFNSKTFGVAYDPALNTGGSINAAGNVFYDVVRIS